MCYEPGARPPLPPIVGGARDVRTQDLILVSDDGNAFAGHGAVHDAPGGPGIVILPDVRGLHGFYVDLARRFAEAGVHALAFDYFGRTAGVGAREEGFEYTPHVQHTRPDTVARDVAASVAHIRSGAGGGATSVFTVGFCFGGRESFNQAARGHGLAGVIGFYGRPVPRDDADAFGPSALAMSYQSPVLGLFGGADANITRPMVSAFEEALRDAGVPSEIVVYDGAPHSFFDRRADQYAEESNDAWRRMLAFIRANATAAPAQTR
jgi:carboxymethylenebutenolidase